MEEYLKLNWAWKTPREDKDLEANYQSELFQDSTDVFLCQLMEIDRFHLVDDLQDTANDHQSSGESSIVRDPRTNKVITKFTIDWRNNDSVKHHRLKTEYPIASGLTKAQHEIVLKAINAFTKSIPLNVEENNVIAAYHQLSELLQQEYATFIEYSRRHFNTNVLHIVERLGKELFPDVQKLYETRRQQRVESFASRKYLLQSAFTAQDVGNLSWILTDECTRKGQVNIFESIPSTINAKIKIADEVIKEFLNTADNNYNFIEADFQLTIETVTAMILSQLDVNTSWIIPVRCEVHHNGSVRCRISDPIGDSNLPGKMKFMIGYKSKLLSLLNQQSESILNLNSNAVDRKLLTENGCKSMEYKIEEFSSYLEKVNKKIRSIVEPRMCSTIFTFSNDGNEPLKFYCDNDYDGFFHQSIEDDGTLVNVSVKVNFQTELGLEKMARDELVMEWSRQRLNPESKTLRITVDAESGTVLGNEMLHLDDIEKELKRVYQIDICGQFSVIIGMLRILKNFPPNEYLLVRKARDKQVRIYAAGDLSDSTGIAFNDIVQQTARTWNEIEFLGIDPMKITPDHTSMTIAPCCFLPCIDNNTQKKVPKFTSDRAKVINCSIRKREAKEQVKQNLKDKLSQEKKRRKNLKKKLKRKAKAEEKNSQNNTTSIEGV